MADISETKSKSNVFKHIIIFIIFLLVGLVLGFYGTSKYLGEKEEEEPKKSSPETKEITQDSMYQDTINELYAVVNNNTLFYSSKGVNISTLDNNTKLSLLYDYLVNKKMMTTETLNRNEFGACDNGFILDPSSSNLPSLVCTVYKMKKDDFVSVSKMIYNSEIDTNYNFIPVNGRSCVSVEDTYVCGNTATQPSGALEIKFDIQKVTLDPDGTIEIYDKGYLADRRDGVDNPNDQYDNYYLHTSDSTTYYYELKSADNVTFKHTFKTDDDTNYYYVSTEVYNG